MVKNTTGGSKSKGMARKNVTNARQASKLRVAMEEGEVYAVVIKILGGQRCSVIGADNVERACIIRGKFRGGQRRDNVLKAGTMVLVGDRDWTTKKEDKAPEADLLEVYSDIDKERLKKQVTGVNWTFANVVEATKSNSAASNDGLVFSDDTTQDEYAELMKSEITSATKTGKTMIAFGEDDENIDIGDI
jgi:translation initiation factor IF-1